LRAILINPDFSKIDEIEVTLEGELPIYQSETYAPHWIVSQTLQGHVGLVSENGIVEKKRLWYFRNVHIWGPMLIVGESSQGYADASVSVEKVRGLVRL
jgi:hypothetical protein